MEQLSLVFQEKIPRFSQRNFEWYTPLEYLKAVKTVLGDIELDPASCEEANGLVQAIRYYDRRTDGLLQKWKASTVFLNPPYCKSGAVSNQELWSCKLIAEYECDNVEQAILLVNAATETAWFQRLYAYPICFIRGRIRFYGPGDKKSPTVGSAFIYLGTDEQKFFEVFQKFGVVVKRVAE